MTEILTPRAAGLPRPPQHLQVPARSGTDARQPIPRTVVLPRPPQHLQVPTLSNELTRMHNPRAAARLGAAAHLKVDSKSLFKSKGFSLVR